MGKKHFLESIKRRHFHFRLGARIPAGKVHSIQQCSKQCTASVQFHNDVHVLGALSDSSQAVDSPSCCCCCSENISKDSHLNCSDSDAQWWSRTEGEKGAQVVGGKRVRKTAGTS